MARGAQIETTDEEVASEVETIAEGSSSSSSQSVPTNNRRRSSPKTWWGAIVKWSKGPDPPIHLQIKPIYPRLQTIPLRILDRYAPKKRQKIGLWAFVCLVWFILFVAVEHYSRFYGESTTLLSCTSSLWSQNNGCGIDAMNCRPFANSSFSFRCPGACSSSSHVLNPRAVGDQAVNYRSFVIGGGLPSSAVDPDLRHYRGDSFVCAAALHAGVISNKKGGCGKLVYTGTQPYFISSSSNTINSIPFDTSFPFSYTVERQDSSSCSDLQWSVFGVTLVFTIIISLFTTSPTVFFCTIFTSIFFEIGMASDAPDVSDPYALASIAITRFLPAALGAALIERYVVRKCLTGLSAQVEKTVLWLGACWFAALNHYTFERMIPIQRLTPRDIAAQPGAFVALIIIIGLLLVIVITQALQIRLEGSMWRYLSLYGLFCGSLLLLLAVPELHLRIHHYILALLLLPGTRIQTRPSLVYQGLLVGLFINGCARWGMDGLLQTGSSLQGDGVSFSALPVMRSVTVGPIMSSSLSSFTSSSSPSSSPSSSWGNVTVSWEAPTWPWDAVSVIVNDVERYRGRETQFTFERRLVEDVLAQSLAESPMTLANGGGGSPFVSFGDGGDDNDKKRRREREVLMMKTASKSSSNNRDNNSSSNNSGGTERENVYIRLGFVSGSSTGDYTMAGTVFTNGTWLGIPSGRTRR